MLKTMPRSPKPAKPSARALLPTAERALIPQISSLSATTRSSALRLGIGDDCAILRVRAGEEIVVTTDFSLEGRHFRRAWHPAAAIGHRALARGLSDIAAMGARPLAAFLSLALPPAAVANQSWLDAFFHGLLTLAAAHNVPLAGGDTAQAPGPHILADIILLGAAPTGRALRRSTARPGDILYTTGSLGGASAELALLAANPRRFRAANPAANHPHLYPQPRLAQGRELLRRHLATACIDLSDGLSTDLTHLCTASHVAAEVVAAALPLHPLAAALPAAAALNAALNGGEDYELLFTAAPTTRLPRKLAGIPITPIGRILPTRKGRPQVTLIDATNHRTPLEPQGWEHFRTP